MRALAFAFVTLATVASSAVGARGAPSFVIYGDTSIGGFGVYKDHGRLSQAIAVFGEPETVRQRRVGSLRTCVARWPALGLSASFFPYAKTCVPERSCFNEAIVTGPRSRTAKGLTIGDSRRRVYQLYPRARVRGASRALLVRPGLDGTFDAVSAKLVNRRVAALRVSASSCEGFFP